MAPVFGLSHLSRRLVESVVGLFAILGFVYVPLGRHTGFEHAKAIFSTPAASAAFEELSASALGLRQRALDLLSGRLTTPPPAPEAAAQPARAQSQPRPVPPKLK